MLNRKDVVKRVCSGKKLQKQFCVPCVNVGNKLQKRATHACAID